MLLEIKKAMEAQGLNKSELADKTGVRLASIVDYLNGKRVISYPNLIKIFEALSLKVVSAEDTAKDFERGSLADIYEKMMAEIPEKGVVGNDKVSAVELASYVLGYLAGVIAKEKHLGEDGTFKYLDKLVHQENDRLPLDFNRSLAKIALFGLQVWNEYERQLFASLCADISDIDIKVNNVAFHAALFRYGH